MPIPKPGSRASDRNKIRRMHAEGYSVDQISRAVSIVPEHVEYVIEKWDIDEEKFKDRQRALQEQIDREFRESQRPANAPPSIDDEERERIRELARRELLAEIEAEKAAEKPKPKRGRPKKVEPEAAPEESDAA